MKPIFIIAGEKSSGKTVLLLELSNMLQKKGYVIGGFVSRHDLESDSYSIRNLQTNHEVLLMQRLTAFKQRSGHFELFPDGLEAGRNWINMLLKSPLHLVVIDEIGRYELDGELWCEGFTNLMNSPLPMLFTTKTKHLMAIVNKWNMEPSAIFYPADYLNPEKAFTQIKNLL